MDIIRISKENVSSYKDELHKAVELYLIIYSAPPYNEKFEFDDVLEEFNDYVENGLLLLTVMTNNKVIGFLATSYGHPCDDQLRQDLINNNIDPSADVYFSEFGVDVNYRCHGVGKLMLNQMLNYHDGKQVYLRTAKNNNDKIINYYSRAGFNVLDVVERVFNKRVNGSIDVDERLYMVKRC